MAKNPLFFSIINKKVKNITIVIKVKNIKVLAKKVGQMATNWNLPKNITIVIKGANVMIRTDDLHNFSFYYPNMVDDVVDCRTIYGGEQLLLMDDGSVWAFDFVTNRIRELPPDPNDMTEQECRIEFGRAMCRIMRWKCIDQLELSELTGLSQPAISSYIRGVRTPSFYAADLIAKALGRPIEEFRYTGF